MTEKINDAPRQRIASGIRQARAAKFVGQKEAAEAVGVTQATWSNWELAITMPSADDLWVMADYFGITIDRLVDRR